MRLKTFNLLENLLGRIFFAIFYTLATFPWVYGLFRIFTETYIKEESVWFFGAAIIVGSGILVLNQRLHQGFWAKFFILLVFIGADMILTYLAGFSLEQKINTLFSPFWFGILIMGGYLLLGMIRYEKILNSGEIDFMSDFGVWSTAMIFALFLKDRFLCPITFYHILYFFLSGIALGIYHKYLDIKDGSEQNRLSWILVVLIVIIFVSLFAIIFTFGFSIKTMQMLLIPLVWAVQLLEKIFLKLLFYILIMLEPLLNQIIAFLQNIILNTKEDSLSDNKLMDLNSITERLQNPQPTGDYTWVFKTLIIFTAFLILVYLIKKFNPRREKELGYEEVRESVFDPAELKNDFLKMIRSFVSRFNRTKLSNLSVYDGSSYVIKIREIYYYFIKIFQKWIPFKKYFTPADYLKKLESKFPEFGHPIRTITGIYEMARYSPQVGAEELREIEKAYQQIMRVLSEKEDN
ncbi:hypothetical protein BBF96_08445 [Anoxybacter fermentans]|uniref:Protein-glutamine gamma-glutamyltransferase-like C-terminal domain-containing protein n=1 Tax=Anoxybacter fermentans TaxID=1323375 RepID=A0A3S9SYM7_9FIRM|nr:DUF4129 domain-containing protein [Anoxybacter fermentans]AZR73409.1 hypothetical protein BBF96_08445 [Anoxybacter fermentans]